MKNLLRAKDVIVDVHGYVFAHGKRPSGCGNWAFYYGDYKTPIWFTGAYSAAKKQAQKWAANRNIAIIVVGS